MLNAALRFDLVQVRADHLPAKDWAFLEHGVQHARHGDVDAVHGLAGDDRVIVDTWHARSNDAELARILERNCCEIWCLDSCCFLSQLGVLEAAAARAVMHRTGMRLTLALRNAPRLRGRRDEHRPRRRADAPHRQPVCRRRCTPAGPLVLELLRVERRLFDAPVFPVDVQLLGDEHWQHRLDALADLRVLGDDRDDAGRRDTNEGVRHEIGGAAGYALGARQCGGAGKRLEVAGDQHATTDQRARAKKVPAADDLAR